MRADSTAFHRGNWMAAAWYPLAVAVSFFVSLFTAMLLLSVGAPVWLVHSATGFVGVFVGSLCLVRYSHVFGSLFLLCAGLVFFYVRFVVNDPGFNPEGFSSPWARLFMLFCGGLLAVVAAGIWQFLRKTKTGSENIG